MHTSAGEPKEVGVVNGGGDDEDLLVNGEFSASNSDEESGRNKKTDINRDRKICGLKEPTYRVLFGVGLVLIIAVSWTGSTQFAKSSYKTHFSAPYFMTWLAQMFYALIFPIYLLSVPCQALTFKQFIRKSLTIMSAEETIISAKETIISGGETVTCRSFWVFIMKALFFAVIAVLTNFFYLKSLEHLLPATVSAIFASQSAFVYILSIVFLGETFLFLRVLSLVLSVGGIVLMSYSEGFGESSSMGILFVCIASLGSATYQVAFKRFMASANGSQVAFLFTIIGILDTVLFWPFIFLLRYVNYEELEWSTIPWVAVLGTALLGLIFSYTVNFGVVFTYPLFISIGTLLGIPLNAIVDTIFRDETFGKYKIIATLMIFVGFCMLLLPVDRVKRVEQKCCANRGRTEDMLE